MTFLHKVLAYPSFRRIWRAAFDNLQDHLWNEVLIRQDFTTLGAARFSQDLLAIQSVVDSVAAETGTAFGMPKLKEGVSLLNLPLEIEGHDPGLSLKGASHSVFAGNAEAIKLPTIDCVVFETFRTVGATDSLSVSAVAGLFAVPAAFGLFPESPTADRNQPLTRDCTGDESDVGEREGKEVKLLVSAAGEGVRLSELLDVRFCGLTFAVLLLRLDAEF